MNRTILIARIMAVVILFVFTLLMFNLYSKLRRLQAEASPQPTATTTDTTTQQ
jgi:hypothetical protein